MNYLTAELTRGAYAVAVKDTTSWDAPSFTNYYVLRRREQTIFIDAGIKAYGEATTTLLRQLAVEPTAITHVLLTHGHYDHVEGADAFVNAQKFVHEADLPLLGKGRRAQFRTYIPEKKPFLLSAAGVEDLDVIHVDTHSPGSVVLYDRLSKSLFLGDFFCFWGEELPPEGLVSVGEAIRSGCCQYVAAQRQAGGAEFVRFMAGLERLLGYEAEFFCTGHGAILTGNIQQFLQALWESGQGSN